MRMVVQNENDQIDPINEIIDNITSTKSLLMRIGNFINLLFFGLGIGTIFFLTSFASMLMIIGKRSAIGTGVGLCIGLIEGTTNAALNSQVTKRIFRCDQYLLLVMLPFTFILIGGVSTLPLVASVLQATDEISDKTGVDITPMKPFLGNMTLLLYGILSSMGFINILTKVYGYAVWKICNSEQHRIVQMKEYLDDKRSKSEYKRFDPSNNNFLVDKFSYGNLIALLISLISFIYAYGVANEIAVALKSKHSVWLINVLDLGGSISYRFAETKQGSLAVSILTQVPLCSMWVATSARTITRDLGFLFSSMKNFDIFSVLKVISYLLFAGSTGLTAAFQAVKGGNSSLVAAFTFFSSCANNYGGPRELFFSTIVPFISKITRRVHCCKSKNQTPLEEEIAARTIAIKKLDNYLGNYQNDQHESRECCFKLFPLDKMNVDDISVDVLNNNEPLLKRDTLSS